MIPKQIIPIGFLGASAVALGAMGAHALKNQLSTGLITEDQIAGFDTGVKYQMYHTLAMFLTVIINKNNENKTLLNAYRFFLWGIICFSGSLYLLCTRHLFGADWLKILGPITPIGGVLFIIGWLLISYGTYKTYKKLA